MLELKATNQELKKKIKYFMTLLEQSKRTKKGVTSGDTSSLRDPSLLDQGDLTKQLGHTENGEISNAVDPVELGSILDTGIK